MERRMEELKKSDFYFELPQELIAQDPAFGLGPGVFPAACAE